MKDKIYKDWQGGTNNKQLAAKYNRKYNYIREVINNSLKQRTCPVCDTVFTSHGGAKFCRKRCSQVYHSRIGFAKPKRKPTLDDYLRTININDYAELQKAETFNMIGGRA